MLQRTTDSAVLGLFSIALSCAVFFLKFRTKPRTALVRRSEAHSQPQGV
jgi:hypothetical protein